MGSKQYLLREGSNIGSPIIFNVSISFKEKNPMNVWIIVGLVVLVIGAIVAMGLTLLPRSKKRQLDTTLPLPQKNSLIIKQTAPFVAGATLYIQYKGPYMSEGVQLLYRINEYTWTYVTTMHGQEFEWTIPGTGGQYEFALLYKNSFVYTSASYTVIRQLSTLRFPGYQAGMIVHPSEGYMLPWPYQDTPQVECWIGKWIDISVTENGHELFLNLSELSASTVKFRVTLDDTYTYGDVKVTTLGTTDSNFVKVALSRADGSTLTTYSGFDYMKLTWISTNEVKVYWKGADWTLMATSDEGYTYFYWPLREKFDGPTLSLRLEDATDPTRFHEIQDIAVNYPVWEYNLDPIMVDLYSDNAGFLIPLNIDSANAGDWSDSSLWTVTLSQNDSKVELSPTHGVLTINQSSHGYVMQFTFSPLQHDPLPWRKINTSVQLELGVTITYKDVTHVLPIPLKWKYLYDTDVTALSKIGLSAIEINGIYYNLLDDIEDVITLSYDNQLRLQFSQLGSFLNANLNVRVDLGPYASPEHSITQSSLAMTFQPSHQISSTPIMSVRVSSIKENVINTVVIWEKKVNYIFNWSLTLLTGRVDYRVGDEFVFEIAGDVQVVRDAQLYYKIDTEQPLNVSKRVVSSYERFSYIFTIPTIFLGDREILLILRHPTIPLQIERAIKVTAVRNYDMPILNFVGNTAATISPNETITLQNVQDISLYNVHLAWKNGEEYIPAYALPSKTVITLPNLGLEDVYIIMLIAKASGTTPTIMRSQEFSINVLELKKPESYSATDYKHLSYENSYSVSLTNIVTETKVLKNSTLYRIAFEMQHWTDGDLNFRYQAPGGQFQSFTPQIISISGNHIRVVYDIPTSTTFRRSTGTLLSGGSYLHTMTAYAVQVTHGSYKISFDSRPFLVSQQIVESTVTDKFYNEGITVRTFTNVAPPNWGQALNEDIFFPTNAQVPTAAMKSFGWVYVDRTSGQEPQMEEFRCNTFGETMRWVKASVYEKRVTPFDRLPAGVVFMWPEGQTLPANTMGLFQYLHFDCYLWHQDPQHLTEEEKNYGYYQSETLFYRYHMKQEWIIAGGDKDTHEDVSYRIKHYDADEIGKDVNYIPPQTKGRSVLRMWSTNLYVTTAEVPIHQDMVFFGNRERRWFRSPRSNKVLGHRKDVMTLLMQKKNSDCWWFWRHDGGKAIGLQPYDLITCRDDPPGMFAMRLGGTKPADRTAVAKLAGLEIYLIMCDISSQQDRGNMTFLGTDSGIASNILFTRSGLKSILLYRSGCGGRGIGYYNQVFYTFEVWSLFSNGALYLTTPYFYYQEGDDVITTGSRIMDSTGTIETSSPHASPFYVLIECDAIYNDYFFHTVKHQDKIYYMFGLAHVEKNNSTFAKCGI
jgi:hypothetical protein